MLQGVAGLVIGFHLPREARAQSGAARPFRPDGGAAVFAPNAFVRIGTDDTVTVLSKHIEFGQGPFTGLATIVAEELDADWSQMRAEHAPANREALQQPRVRPIQGTGGSTAIANSYDQMRKAGATARAMLVTAAANAWNVPAAEITVERGVLRHAASKRARPVRPVRGGCREIAGAGQRTAEGPVHVQADRPRRCGAQARQRRQDQRHGAVHHRYPRARHADSGGRASGPLRRQGRDGRRRAKRAGRGRRRCQRCCRGCRGLRRTAPGRRSRRASCCRSPGTKSAAEKRGSDAADRGVSRARTQARPRRGPAWRCRTQRSSKAAQGDRGGVRLSVSGACADGAARRLSALGWREGAGALRQPVPDIRAGRPLPACSD